MKLFVKRVISVALAACMAIGSAAVLNAEKIGDLTASFAVKAAAATIVDSGKCGDNVTYTLYSYGLLTISGVGIMYEYSRVQHTFGEPYISTAPWGNKKFTRAVISDGVTSIGDAAFAECDSLTSITIPDSVTSIGNEAFFACTGLKSISIGNSVTSIGECAFLGCTGLTSITIPDSVTSIGNDAFLVCTGLTSITIPDSVASIGDGAFSGCIGLKSITIPNSVTRIGDLAFFACTGLTSVTIPDGVTFIGGNAFHPVPNIVYSGTASGSPWGARALNGYIEDGIVYEDSSKTKLLACPSLREGTVVIPNSVTLIGDYAFYECSGLTSITIPDSVTSIGESAFCGCSSLTSITIPNSVTSISEDTFYGCNSLTSITISDNVTSIGKSAFYSCDSLTSITIPDGATSIGNSAFSDCTALTSIMIPDGVTNIGDNAFRDVPNIAYSGIASGSPWGARALNGYIEDGLVYEDSSKAKLLACPSSREGAVAIPNSVTSIGDRAFYDCDSLTSITIPDGVTSIGNSAFSGCDSLTSITIPSGVTSIGNFAFSGCDSLTSITIPDGVTSIGDYAFSSCRSLTSITISSGVTSIGNSAFSYCDSLTSITIPDGVTSIGDYAFRGCNSLTSITIPSGVTSIGKYAFYNCDSLTSVTIPSGVTSIGYSAFYEVLNIAYVGTASGSPWGARALNGYIEDGLVYEDSSKTKLLACPVSREGAVVIPNSVTSIGWGAFDNCYKLTEVYILNPDCITEESSDGIFSSAATIYSHAGYDMEKYANKYGYSFAPIHINENTATAKCTEEVTEAKCKYCDEITLPVLIHDFTAENTDEKYLCEAATCYSPASYYVSCKDCGLSSKDLPSEKTFTYGEAVDHKGKWVVSYPATCTSSGYEIEYCIYCDCNLGGRTIPTTEHTGGDPVEENITATCTDPGTCDSVVYCVVCGEELSRTLKELPALGHIEEVIPAVAANCVHTGLTEGKKCIRCKEILVKQQEIAKTAHTWDNGTVTREPQVGVAGERTFTCTVCSATRTEEIAPLVPSAPDLIEVKSSDSAKELTGGIVGATHSVTVSELLASSNASFVVDKDGNRVTDTKPLATGMKIILESGGERLEKVISVLGDVNGDGDISVSDARGALRAAVGLDTLEGAYLNAARVNGANEVAVSDARSILRAAVALDTGKDWLANIK